MYVQAHILRACTLPSLTFLASLVLPLNSILEYNDTVAIISVFSYSQQIPLKYQSSIVVQTLLKSHQRNTQMNNVTRSFIPINKGTVDY